MTPEQLRVPVLMREDADFIREPLERVGQWDYDPQRQLTVHRQTRIAAHLSPVKMHGRTTISAVRQETADNQ